MNSFNTLLLAAIFAVSITSCVVTDGPGGIGGPTRRSASSSFGIYDVLPRSYVGDAYYHQNRYYYGGNYQRGSFHDHGRQYSERYYHGGQYYYGGRHDHHDSRSNQSHSSRGNDRGYGRR